MSDTPAPDAVEQEARKLWGLLQQQVREADRVEWGNAGTEIRAECLRVVRNHQSPTPPTTSKTVDTAIGEGWA